MEEGCRSDLRLWQLAAEVLGVRGSRVLKSYEERLESTSRAGQAGKAGLHNLTAIACSSEYLQSSVALFGSVPGHAEIRVALAGA